MFDDDTPRMAGWEEQVLDRLRERLETTCDETLARAGWEAVAVERLRAHFENEN